MTNDINEENIKQTENEAPSVEKTKEELLNEQKEYYLRIIADYENRTKRIKQDAVQSINLTIENVALDLIPLIQNLSAAIQISENEVKKGLELVENNLKNILKKYGIEEICPEIGSEFDPDTSEVISSEQDTKEEAGKVLKVASNGYKLNKKIIAPALVIVSL